MTLILSDAPCLMISSLNAIPCCTALGLYAPGIQFSPTSLCDQLCSAAGLLTEPLARNDEFFRLSLIHLKLPFTNMLPCNPHLILEFPSLLAIFMLEDACGIQAGVELADGLDVGELAIEDCTICTVAACWRGRMFEWASCVGAIWIEFAVHLGLVCNPLSG